MSDTAWTHPGAHEVSPGVYRIPLPMPSDGLRAVNVYALWDSAGIALVDGGWALPESRRLLGEALETLGARPADITRILVTHAHRDHYTQAIALREELGCHVALGEGERANLERLGARDHIPLERQRRELVECGAEHVLDELSAEFDTGTPEHGPHWQQPDEWLSDGTELVLAERTLRVVSTPGHTRGHVVFHDEDNGLVFTGDHVLPAITPSVGLEQAPGPLPLRDYLDSLHLVRKLPDDRILPAHGPVHDSLRSRVDELLSHHQRRLDTMAATVERGASTAYETARALNWTRHERTLDELDVFSRILAVLETSAHLKLLVSQRRLASERSAGVLRYSCR
ncbi:MBL fold metallo-hydrolase [Actinopolyspora mortivallis]|uniref:MBL fold metallo-hydrolase n=1 Tax=Actinopolyspora mortivallis TaxID=33906 RepID=UPI000374D059|nr:MBL fold metallo-hydrolase [Actinopolyspora mortivallis]